MIRHKVPQHEFALPQPGFPAPLRNGLPLGPVAAADGGRPIPGAAVSASVASTLSGADGSYRISLAAGSYELKAHATCFQDISAQVEVVQDLQVNFLLPPVPPASGSPVGLRAAAGPGNEMITVEWDVPTDLREDFYAFQIHRGSSATNLAPIANLGNDRAFADTKRVAGSTSHYSVSALDVCGAAGVKAASVSATSVAGFAPLTSVAPTSFAATPKVETYAQLSAAGEPAGSREWRTVAGTGNCCEVYVATTPDGRIVDLGGHNVRISADEGRTWTQVVDPLLLNNGEGAIAYAPGGDILGMTWHPYEGDRFDTFKYVARDGTWYFSESPLHQPFADRPWITVVKGPFQTPTGGVSAYVGIVTALGANDPRHIYHITYDGLTYQELALPYAPLPKRSVDLANLVRDADRDWLQPVSYSRVYPVTHGLALLSFQGIVNVGCEWGVLGYDMTLSCADFGQATLPRGSLLVDSNGSLHVLSFAPANERYFTRLVYRTSTDGGRTWNGEEHPLPEAYSAHWENTDFKVNARLDQAVVFLHAQSPSAASPERNQDLAYRFRGVSGTPWLSEVLRLGPVDDPDRTGGDPVAGKCCIDFVTVGILPSGHIVAGFTDESRPSPLLLGIET
ncbi:MAG: carboxypeptidase regulatory-like domain-containing protein [Euryarchaeota archaeon]|nr:carboxypeptidase regulatory-like domain-containing protein [Euryarchaeota archaeon]